MSEFNRDWIQVTRSGAVGAVIFNRDEKLNALTDEMLDLAGVYLGELGEDDGVKVVVLKGCGRCFSVGYDIGPAIPLPKDSAGVRRWADRRYSLIGQIWELAKPVIAQVHGYCLAGANDLANVCDITVASEDAVFGYPAVRWGGHTHRLTYAWHMPMKQVRELLFTGDSVTAAQALAWGMVNHVVAREALEEYVCELAGRIALMPAEGLAINKISINQTYELMGYRNAMSFTNQIANTNMLRRSEFFESVQAVGLREALRQRDDPFVARREVE